MLNFSANALSWKNVFVEPHFHSLYQQRQFLEGLGSEETSGDQTEISFTRNNSQTDRCFTDRHDNAHPDIDEDFLL